jgi:predicted MFS family arabinose efflux permease
MVLFAGVLRLSLPDEEERPRVTYPRLVATTVRMLVHHPVLRRRAWYGATCFAAFSTLWTTIAFLLSGAPYHYSNLVIGLFGLAGVAGVGAANLAGRLADNDRRRVTTALAAILVVASFALQAAGKTSVVLLLLGIVVLDAGVQGMQIVNQSVIYELEPEARSRINSAYMTCYFVGGAVGSVAAGSVYAAGGWDAVCLLGAGFGVLALAMTVVDRVAPARVTSARVGSVASSSARSQVAWSGRTGRQGGRVMDERGR